MEDSTNAEPALIAEDVVELKALVDGLRATLNEAIDRLVDYGESPDAWYAKAYEASHPTPPLCFRLIEDNGSFCGRTLPCPEHSDGSPAQGRQGSTSSDPPAPGLLNDGPVS